MRLGGVVGLALAAVVIVCHPSAAHEEDSHDVAASSSSSSIPAVQASEIFLCRKCGALIARGVHYLPGTPGHAQLQRVLEAADLGPGKRVYEFANPHGVAQGIVPFAEAEPGAVRVTSTSTDDHSYYPGYAWRVATCAKCGAHVGFQFERLWSAPAPADGSEARPALEGAPKDVVGGAQAMAHSQDAEGLLLEALRGMCILIPQGYWTFRVCFGKDVRQQHTEPGASEPSVDWSLGQMDQSGRVERVSGTASVEQMSSRRKAAYFTSHFFVDGQRCDETKRPRSTEVQYFCCSDAERARAKSSSESTHPLADLVQVLDVSEPSTCKYRIRLCTPLVCDSHPHTLPATSHTSAASHASGASHTSAPASSASSASKADAPPGPRVFFAALYDALVGDRSADIAWINQLPVYFSPRIVVSRDS